MKLRILTFMTLLGLRAISWGTPISITDPSLPYTQDFNSLASSGTGHSSLPPGWAIHEDGSNADGLYRAGTGSSNTGDTYSFGASGDSDRALGGLRSGSLIPSFGAQFRNDSGQTIVAMTIAYWGEQWRLGFEDRADRLLFAYSLDATSLADGTWTAVPDLNFATPDFSGVGAKNGNDTDHRYQVTATISGLSIQPGDTWWIRWEDYDAPGADDGLAVDDLTITFQTMGGPATMPDGGATGALLGLALAVLGVGRGPVRRRESQGRREAS
ncbi:PEP-CTERM sorting domain-containing protein [Limisphaera sp. 4302-co]|uniref:PEP-CTERM sorting domain-containing protein n=1 Tax=Limisphaera sp. 4302-co TaxID=3400417 RepID=UPI003C136A8B